MTSTPHRRQPLTSLTADAVLRLIRERGLSEGDPIPSAAEMAETLGVSRPVIREAIAELAGQGLLHRQQGAQSVVTVPGGSELERLLRLRFAVRGGGLDQVQELRESIEVAAARLAATKATKHDIALLGERLGDLRAARDDDERHRADLAFHRAVVEASGNELMQVVSDGVAPLLDELLLLVWEGWTASGREARELVEAHRRILDAIAEGDPDAAGRAMHDNLQQGRTGASATVAPRS
jgi:GntR family transcriptional regulator, transcriptional repressor for pyruvate dehydrogenase complex